VVIAFELFLTVDFCFMWWYNIRAKSISYKAKVGIFLYLGVFVLILSILKSMNLIKCKFHQDFSMVILTCLKLVWRLSEFAFLCDNFGCRTFYFRRLL